MALDFLILYEHTVREYESDLLLKLELELQQKVALILADGVLIQNQKV